MAHQLLDQFHGGLLPAKPDKRDTVVGVRVARAPASAWLLA